jgi:succinoglycan biosynthesis protein ExoV
VRLFYWETAEGPNNFGDALNPWLWPRELGSGLVGNDGPWLVGIGSLLGDVRPFPEDGLKLVVGAGSGYGRLPVLDRAWRVYGVRGPLTAARLDLPPEAAACDPAILVGRHFDYGAVPRRAQVALMLHWRSVNTAWRALARKLGWTFVDPRDTVENVMRDIAGAELLLTEALHGAIVADAFRVPWTPIRTSPEILGFKWEDWCASVGLAYEPVGVWPLYHRPERDTTARRTGRAIKRLLVERELKDAARRPPQLSSRPEFEGAVGRMDAALDRLREDSARGEFRGLVPVSREGGEARRAGGG